MVPLIQKSLKVAVVLLGIVFIAENLQVNITSLIAGLGIGGAAIAFASQDFIKNLFGSVSILMDRPFEVGDWVVIGEVEGNVMDVGFRTTKIRTFYNSIVTLPNSMLLQHPVDNYGARTYRRWKTTLGVTYETTPEKMEAFCEGVRELIRVHPYTRKGYFIVEATDFGPSSLDILLYMFFETPDWPTELRERHRLLVDIVRLANRLGVEFAYPTQTLYMNQAGESEVRSYETAESYANAYHKGRSEARSVVEHTLGKDGKIPPPVSFGDVEVGDYDTDSGD